MIMAMHTLISAGNDRGGAAAGHLHTHSFLFWKREGVVTEGRAGDSIHMGLPIYEKEEWVVVMTMAIYPLPLLPKGIGGCGHDLKHSFLS